MKCGRTTFYHATLYGRLPKIREHGLIQGGSCGITPTWGLRVHCQGRVFVSKTLDAGLEWYDNVGTIHGFTDAPVLLRVRLDGGVTRSDRLGRKLVAGSRYVEETIPRDCIDFYAPNLGWRPIAEFNVRRWPKNLAVYRQFARSTIVGPSGRTTHIRPWVLYVTSHARGGFKPNRGSTP